MSQKKVDAYKAQKANRGKNSKKERMLYRIEAGITMVVICIMVLWMGYSVYDKATEKEPEAVTTQETVIDTTALDEVIAELNADAAEAE